jgi:hypothetical protein
LFGGEKNMILVNVKAIYKSPYPLAPENINHLTALAEKK